MHLPRVDSWVHHWAHHWAHRWAVASQQHARRNALVAATALTQRRVEAREVEDYLASRAVRRPGTGAGTTADPPAALPR